MVTPYIYPSTTSNKEAYSQHQYLLRTHTEDPTTVTNLAVTNTPPTLRTAADTKSVTVTIVLSTAAQLAARIDPNVYTLRNRNVSILRSKGGGPSRARGTTQVPHGQRHPIDGIGRRRIHRRRTIGPKTNQGPEVPALHHYWTILPLWRTTLPLTSITRPYTTNGTTPSI